MVVFFSALKNTGIVLTLISPEEEVVDESKDWGHVDESEERHGTWRELITEGETGEVSTFREEWERAREEVLISNHTARSHTRRQVPLTRSTLVSGENNSSSNEEICYCINVHRNK